MRGHSRARWCHSYMTSKKRETNLNVCILHLAMHHREAVDKTERSRDISERSSFGANKPSASSQFNYRTNINSLVQPWQASWDYVWSKQSRKTRHYLLLAGWQVQRSHSGFKYENMTLSLKVVLKQKQVWKPISNNKEYTEENSSKYFDDFGTV